MHARPVWFSISAFSTKEISKELSVLADAQDTVLQEYLKGQSSKEVEAVAAPVEAAPPVPSVNASEKDDLPF